MLLKWHGSLGSGSRLPRFLCDPGRRLYLSGLLSVGVAVVLAAPLVLRDEDLLQVAQSVPGKCTL